MSRATAFPEHARNKKVRDCTRVPLPLEGEVRSRYKSQVCSSKLSTLRAAAGRYATLALEIPTAPPAPERTTP